MPSYPASIYSRPDPIPALMSDTPTHSTILGQYGDEIEALEGTLGVNPQGAFATVASRFARRGCEASNSAFAIASGASVFVALTTEADDTDNYHSGSATSLVIPAGLAGVYSVSAFVSSPVPVNGSAGLSRMSIIKNGSSTIASTPLPVGASDISASRSLALVAADTVALQIANGHGTSLNWLAVLSVYLISS